MLFMHSFGNERKQIPIQNDQYKIADSAGWKTSYKTLVFVF